MHSTEQRLTRNRPFLVDRMRERADADGLPELHPLRVRANALRAALDAPMLEDAAAVESFLHRWAEARAAWTAYSGETFH